MSLTILQSKQELIYNLNHTHSLIKENNLKYYIDDSSLIQNFCNSYYFILIDNSLYIMNRADSDILIRFFCLIEIELNNKGSYNFQVFKNYLESINIGDQNNLYDIYTKLLLFNNLDINKNQTYFDKLLKDFFIRVNNENLDTKETLINDIISFLETTENFRNSIFN